MFKALFIVVCAMFAFNFSAVACPGVKDCPLHKSGDKANDHKKGECKLHKKGDKMAHHDCQKEGCKKAECKLHKKGGDYHKNHHNKDDKKG